MEERNGLVKEAQTYREDARERIVSGSRDRFGRAGQKRVRIIAAIAVIALTAVTGTLAFSDGKHSATETGPVQLGVSVPATYTGNTGSRLALLTASSEDKPAASADSTSQNTEAFFPEGDYSGRTDENGKDSDGMTLPEAGAGETLYIGYSELPHVGLTKVALVLSESGTEVHDITIFLKSFDNQLNGGALSGISSIQTSNTKAFHLPVKDETLGESTIQEITAEDGQMFVRMDYSFRFYAALGNDSQLIHLGEMELWLKKAG